MNISNPNLDSVKRLWNWSQKSSANGSDPAEVFEKQRDHFSRSVDRLIGADGSEHDMNKSPGAVALHHQVEVRPNKSVLFVEYLKPSQEGIALAVLGPAVNGIGYGFAFESLGHASQPTEETVYQVRPGSSQIAVTKRAIGHSGDRLAPREFTLDLEQGSLIADLDSKKEFLDDLIAAQEARLENRLESARVDHYRKRFEKTLAQLGQRLTKAQALGEQGQLEVQKCTRGIAKTENARARAIIYQARAADEAIELTNALKANRQSSEFL